MADSTTAMMQGDLERQALPELLQFLQSLRKKGQLLIERAAPRQAGGIYFASGRVVHAYCPPALGEDAFYQLLRWRSGRFVFIEDAAPERETIRAELASLLLEGMRLSDEESRPRTGVIFHPRRDRFTPGRDRVSFREFRLLALLDGRRTVADVAAASGHPVDLVAADLARLQSIGMVAEQQSPARLEAIVPALSRPTVKHRSGEIPILGMLILNHVDGRRSLRDIQERINCTERDLIDEFTYLLRHRWVHAVRGQEWCQRWTS
jgi:hypothetical protein